MLSAPVDIELDADLDVALDTALDFAALRAREFARLDARGLAYLDYAATALYGASQVRAHHALLAGGVLGNPHSESAPSRDAAAAIERARRQVLAWFDADDATHDVCFTANASAAIKLVAESYRFGPRAQLVLSADNHNSVNGLREYARRAGAAVTILPLDAELRLADPEPRLAECAARGGGLVALPAQSNFSGVCHPLALVARARALGFDVLLDAAAFAPSHPLSLRACPADFAVVSFHKLFGYPTGAGALIARRDALARLARPWFAGGTVAYASVGADMHRLHPGHAGFEDGTPDFLGLAALPAGFALLTEVGMPRLSAHVARLTRALLDDLVALRHACGAPVVQLYGPPGSAGRGGTVALNVRDPRGDVVPYRVVEGRAREAGVAVRGGCFCNPGAAEAAFGLDPAALAACLAASGDDVSPLRIAGCLGRPVGAVRLSLGLATSRRDIARAVAVLASFAA
ncbi:MAG TPA: aminotransferase class V-fold PLP-dependent enzyme [Kofleriaceae bacterium]|jgi:selenocysteine lyase/cysteine desulfurase|nr:aminotransferase class V-fold PLP-dependent enzyme [Kofleriaceae bacterium]